MLCYDRIMIYKHIAYSRHCTARYSTGIRHKQYILQYSAVQPTVQRSTVYSTAQYSLQYNSIAQYNLQYSDVQLAYINPIKRSS